MVSHGKRLDADLCELKLQVHSMLTLTLATEYIGRSLVVWAVVGISDEQIRYLFTRTDNCVIKYHVVAVQVCVVDEWMEEAVSVIIRGVKHPAK